jgi:hypothetical protein
LAAALQSAAAFFRFCRFELDEPKGRLTTGAIERVIRSKFDKCLIGFMGPGLTCKGLGGPMSAGTCAD